MEEPPFEKKLCRDLERSLKEQDVPARPQAVTELPDWLVKYHKLHKKLSGEETEEETPAEKERSKAALAAAEAEIRRRAKMLLLFSYDKRSQFAQAVYDIFACKVENDIKKIEEQLKKTFSPKTTPPSP